MFARIILGTFTIVNVNANLFAQSEHTLVVKQLPSMSVRLPEAAAQTHPALNPEWQLPASSHAENSPVVATPATSESNVPHLAQRPSTKITIVTPDKQGKPPAKSSEKSDSKQAIKNPVEGSKTTTSNDTDLNEVIRERYPNTNVKVERHVVQDQSGNFVNHGLWTQYDEKGRIEGSGRYSEGKRDGKWMRHFAPNEGKMFSTPAFRGFSMPFSIEANFNNDQLHGVWQVTDGKNRKVCTLNFQDGKSHGKSTWYHPNGTMQREIPYVDGDIDGKVIEYGTDGKELMTETFIAGRRLSLKTEYYAPKVKQSEGFVLLPKEVVKPNLDFWNGVANYTIIGKEGTPLRHGQWTWFYKTGRMKMQGEYKNDEADGKMAWWYENGQKQLEGEYVAGKEQGPFVWFHPNGMKMTTGQYENGHQVETWTRWNDAGQVVEIARFSKSGEQIEFKQFPPAVVEIEKPKNEKPAHKIPGFSPSISNKPNSNQAR
jgi:antitoxin component YwqK of YwqJK toxin-antitoxin module